MKDKQILSGCDWLMSLGVKSWRFYSRWLFGMQLCCLFRVSVEVLRLPQFLRSHDQTGAEALCVCVFVCVCFHSSQMMAERDQIKDRFWLQALICSCRKSFHVLAEPATNPSWINTGFEKRQHCLKKVIVKSCWLNSDLHKTSSCTVGWSACDPGSGPPSTDTADWRSSRWAQQLFAPMNQEVIYFQLWFHPATH